MKKILTGLLILGFGFGMSGCADPQIDDSQIKKYKSTKKDVRRVLGNPNMTSTRNGKETWTYTKSKIGINKKGAGVMGAMYAATLLVPGAPIVALGIGALGYADDPTNMSPVKGKNKSASYTFNKRGVLIAISKTSFGT